MSKPGAFISAAGLGAIIGAFGVSISALIVYLATDDGSPASAKVAAALSVHLLATAVMFVVACVVGATIYLLAHRFRLANYWTIGAVGLAVGLALAPTPVMSVGGLVAALVFHWRFRPALDESKQESAHS